MTLTRRSLFPIAGAISLSAVTVGKAETPVADHHGLNVSLRLGSDGKWEVMVPARTDLWRPGFAYFVEWVPLMDFLNDVQTATQGSKS